MFTSRPIGFARTDYKTTSDIPRGLGTKHYDTAVLEILPEFAAGLTDIEGFSHLYVIWEFDRSEGFELMGTPPSDDRPHGVFATRSPKRPNPIALTVVQLLGRDGAKLRVRGLDMLDGTPILDIKPYLSSVPAEILKRGWLAEAEARSGRAAAATDAAADTLPDEIYLCTFDELFDGLTQPQTDQQFALLTTLVQKLGYQIASGRDPNFHEVWALSAAPPTSAQEFERRFLAWVHLTTRVLPMRRADPDEGWALQLPHSKVNFSVLDASARAARQTGDEWVLRVREHEPTAFISQVESHFAPGSSERRQMADGGVLAQFRSSQLRRVFEDQTDRT